MSDDDLRLPSLGLMRRHLRTIGWQGTILARGDLELFTRKFDDGTAVEIVLPSKSTANDLAERMLPALRTLASLSNRDVKTVAAEISMLDFDILWAKLPDSAVLRDSISLRVAEKFTGNTRRFLASASAAEQKRAITVDDSQKLGADYANRCRFGHTFRGSFGFTIESPAGPAPDLPEDSASPPPFERRIFERIATGIAMVEKAYTLGSPEPLEHGAASGFNVNMLEDFTSLVADSSARSVSFSFSMTPEWPSPNSQFAAVISQEVLPLIDRVVSSLRPPVTPAAETIVGQVIMLATRENPTDLLHEGTREISIDGVSVQRGPITVRVRLSPADYLIAHSAHGEGKAVSVTGLVTRSSRGNLLSSPTGFREA